MSTERVVASTAVIVLNCDGREHLRTCLPAVLALDGLAGLGAVLVADNHSSDGSVAMVEREFPGVRTHSFAANLGFAAGNNEAARIVDAEHVLFLNNDTAPANDVLVLLANELARGSACAGARTVDWSGRRIDFDGGGATFTGHGHPLGHGRRVPAGAWPPGATLFCSGAAMLVDLATFLDLGGFDPGYFAYYEDVDLGWRLWQSGLDVVHVPGAVVRHRGGATGELMLQGRRARLHEANALANVVKWYDAGRLRYLLPAALALAAVRAGADPDVVDSARLERRFGLPLPSTGWGGWPALEPLALDWCALAGSRSATQARRRVPDVRVLPLLAEPLAPVPPTATMREAMARAMARYHVAAVLGVGDKGLHATRESVGGRYRRGRMSRDH